MVRSSRDVVMIETLKPSDEVNRVAFYQAALEELATPIGEDELRILTARSADKTNQSRLWY